MSFTSQLYPTDIIINDSTPNDIAMPKPGQSTGYMGASTYDAYLALKGVSALPQKLIIPRSDWQGMIEEKEERGMQISQISIKNNLKLKHQKNTSLCWTFGPTRAHEIHRMFQNQEQISLSPASAGAQIKNFSDPGGWGTQFLEWIIEHGQCPSSVWPDTSFDRSLVNAENKAIALNYRPTEWFVLKPRNLDEQISCLLRNIPLGTGRNWQGHEVCDVDAIWLDGEVAVRYDDSYDRRLVFQGNRLLADDLVAIAATQAS